MERRLIVTLAGEFFRYALVGGVAFLADFGVLVTGAVLVWNYLGRKLLIFNAKETST